MPKSPRVDRPEVHGQLSRLVPLVALEGDRITEELATRQGLHRTDVQALSLLMDADACGEAVTAGSLGHELRLTSGATTFCITRLEKAGLALRERDANDHRKVNISLSVIGRALGSEFLHPIGTLRERVMNQFSVDELDVVKRFLSSTVAAMTQYRESLSDDPVPRA